MAVARTMLVKLAADVSQYNKNMQLAQRQTTMLNKELQLWSVTNNTATNSSKYMAQQLSVQKQQQSVLAQQIEVTKSKLADTISKYGEGSTQAMLYKNKLLDLEIQHEKLGKSIKDASNPLIQFKTRLNNIAESAQNIGQKLQNMGMQLTTAFTLPIVAVGASAVKASMSAKEAENLFDVSFGNMAANARAFSEQLANTFNRDPMDIRQYMGTFNIMLGSMKMGEKNAYDMAKGLTHLTYDISSLYNISESDAFQKLQSGISGEIEPLRRLGITVSENTVKTFAYTHGLAKQGQELTEQQKILARYGVIMEATQKAQNDLTRTKDSEENRTRTLTAQINILKRAIGDELLPVYNKLLTVGFSILSFLRQMIERFNNLNPVAKNVVLIFLGIAAAAGPLLMILGGMAQGVSVLAQVFAFLATTPGLVIAAIIALAGILIYLYNTNEAVRQALQAAWRGLVTFAMAVFSKLGQWWAVWGNDVFNILASIWNTVVTIIVTAFNVIGNLFSALGSALNGDWAGMWNSLLAAGKTAITGLLKAFLYLSNGAISILKIMAGNILDGIFAKLVKGFEATVNALIGAYQGLDKMLGDKLPNISKISISQDTIDRIKPTALLSAGQEQIAKWIDQLNSIQGVTSKTVANQDKFKNMFNIDYDKINWQDMLDNLESMDGLGDKAADSIDKVGSAIDQFTDKLKEQTKAFAEYVNIFDKTTNKRVSESQILRNARQQADQVRKWSEAMIVLEARLGENSALLSHVRNLGPQYEKAATVMANMTDSKLSEVAQLFNEKMEYASIPAFSQVKVEHSGTIVIQGVGSQKQFSQIVQIVTDNINADKDRYTSLPGTSRMLK